MGSRVISRLVHIMGGSCKHLLADPQPIVVNEWKDPGNDPLWIMWVGRLPILWNETSDFTVEHTQRMR